MSKEYYLKHRIKILAQMKQYRIENKEKVRENKRKSYYKNRKRIALQSSQYYQKNKEQIRIWNKEYRIKNKEQIKQTKKIYCFFKPCSITNIFLNTLKIKKKLYHQKVKNTEPFKERRRVYNKLYNQTPKRKKWNRLYARKNYKRDKERQVRYWANNPDSFIRHKIWRKNYNKIYRKQHRLRINLQIKTRRENDPNFKMRSTLRSRIWTVLKRRNTTQLASTLTLLGVDSVETVIHHIEKYEG